MAKKCYCAPMTEVEDRLVITATVPVGETYTAGMVISPTALDGTIRGNYSVYSGIAPTDVKTQPLALIINGGFETLPDGRRPAGQVDYTQYTYEAGETFTAVFLADHLRFQLTSDCITGTPVIGQFLNGTDDANTLTAGATKASTDCLTVEAKKFFRTGEANGLGGVNAYVCSASTHNTIA